MIVERILWPHSWIYLEPSAAPIRLMVKSGGVMSETETVFAWVFGLALGAVFTAILIINALAF
jgi:hypothetical protein